MKAKLIRDMKGPECAQFPDGRKPAGTEIDDPESFWLVRMGVAVPGDEECRKAAGMNDSQMSAAQRAYERVALGIHPDDYERFDAGEIVGYDQDGRDIPGPNYVPDEDETEEEYE